MFSIFSLVREKGDLDAEESFMPDMTHQVFGERLVIEFMPNWC